MEPNDEIAAALSAFLQLVASEAGEVPELQVHLSAPRDGSTAWLGSELGARLWARPHGQRVLSAFLAEPDLAEYYAPPPRSRLIELRGRIGSFVARSIQEPLPADAFVAANLSRLLSDLRADPSAISLWLMRGIEEGAAATLHTGLHITPLNDELIELLMEKGFPAGAVGAPRDVSGAYVGYLNSSRSEWGAVASASASAWSEVLFRELSLAVWLATGTYPQPAARFSAEDAVFPTSEGFQMPGGIEEQTQDVSSSERDAFDEGRLRDAFWRVYERPWADDDSAFELDTSTALWDAFSQVTAVLHEHSAEARVLKAYAMIEGLLSRRQDSRSGVVRNVANLIGDSAPERRRLRGIVEALYEIRSATAHGHRPFLDHVSRALERRIAPEEVDWIEERSVFDALSNRVSAIARRVFGSVLWITLDVNLPASLDQQSADIRPRWTHAELLDSLRRAAAGDMVAQESIDQSIPAWLRTPI